MAQGEHTHEWKYNEVKLIQYTNGNKRYRVIRFCTDCLKVEEITLLNEALLSNKLEEKNMKIEKLKEWLIRKEGQVGGATGREASIGELMEVVELFVKEKE